MFTGYFNKLKQYEERGLVPVSICGKAPDWYKGYQYKKLAPKWSFFNEWKSGTHKGDNDYYIEHFNDEVLNNLDVEIVLEELSQFSNDLDKIVLICYEKPSDFCHRHLVAEWISKNSYFNCVEYIEDGIKLMVCGSRGICDEDLIFNAIDELVNGVEDEITIIQGEARGVDLIAKKWATINGKKVMSFPAKWDIYGKSAGFKRNVVMVNECDCCLIFWDGESKGTKHDIELCEKMNKPHKIIKV